MSRTLYFAYGSNLDAEQMRERCPASRTLFRAPRHPYTQALLQSVLTPDPRLGVPDAHLGAIFPNPINPPAGCTFHPRCAHCMELCRATAPAPLTDQGATVECHLYGGDRAAA